MSGVSFISQTIQDYYDDTAAAQTFRTDGTEAEDATIRSLDARISSFEQVIFDKTLPAGVSDDVFPYNKDGLTREFLDEVLAMLLMRTTGTAPNLVSPYLKTTRVEVRGGDFSSSSHDTVVSNNSYNVLNAAGGTIRDADVTIAANTHYHTFVDDDPTSTTDTITETAWDSGADADVIIKGFRNFDDLTRDQKLALLSKPGRDVYTYYEKLIKDVFDAGTALEAVRDAHTGVALDHNAAPVVTAITPITIQHTAADGTSYSVTYDHVTTFKQLKSTAPADPNADKFDYITHLVEAGLETYSLRKIPITNTAGATVGFDLGFNDATTKDTRYLPVTLVNGVYTPAKKSDGVTPIDPVTLKLRNMYIDDYLYFWNEARTRILRASLAYKEAVTKEMQEDLRQANEVLAELERLAAGAKTPGGTTGADTVAESTLMDMWEARTGGGSQFPKIFSTVGPNNVPDDTHTYADWQENRTNLKNYIDRKSAQSQQAMLDYQTVLNRYNNAFEIMSKIQEKIDSLLKGQLRNYN